MSTLYTVHHETSAAQSRKLTLWFWGGVLLSFISYSLVAWIFLNIAFRLFAAPSNTAPGFLGFSVLIGLATSLFVLYGYYLAREHIRSRSAIELAEALGAETLGTPQYPAEKQYRNIVEEMAVAAGISPPDIMIKRDDNSINAFVIGGMERSIAIAVTAGALRYLRRDELQALIAHEFGHIVNDDLVLYGRLTAIIHGYRFLAEQRHKILSGKEDILNEREKMLISNSNPQNEAEALAIRQLAYASARRRREDAAEMENLRAQSYFGAYGAILAALIFVLSTYSLLLTGYARLMQAAIAREREWMADAKAVQFTRNGDALAGVFKKVLALQSFLPAPDSVLMENRHLLLINYLQKNTDKRLHTHPNTITRLKRYGNYDYEEISQLAYALQDIPPYQQIDTVPERSATHFAETLFPLMLLRHHANRSLPGLSPEAIMLAAMMRLANATPKGLAQAGILDKERLRALLPAWQKLLPAHQTSFLPIFLKALKQCDNPAALRAPLEAIARSDGLICLPEWCALTALDLIARPKPTDNAISREEAAEDIRTVLRMAAHLLGKDEQERAALFAELPRHTLPIAPMPWQSLATHKATPAPCKGKDEKGWPIEPLLLPSDEALQSLQQALAQVRRLRPIYRQALLNGLRQQMESRKQLTSDTYAYLCLLKTLFG